jgi:hypothetical protein
MAYTSRKPPPPEIWDDPKLMALFQWMEGELDAIAQDSQETNALELRETNAAPSKPREGMIVRADGTNWNPGTGKGLYTYKNGAWSKVNEGTVDKYSSIADGTTTAAASGADTIKFRASSAITVAVGSNDVTHGDNVLYSLDLSALAAETSIATGDYVILRDVSAGANVKMLITDVLKILASLTDLGATPADDDKFFVYDLSATAVKRVDYSNLASGWTLISSQSANGSTEDITVPAGYTEIKVCGRHLSLDGNQNIFVKFSVDAGSSFELCGGMAFNHLAAAGASAAADCPLFNGVTSSALFYDIVFSIMDYDSSEWKQMIGGTAIDNNCIMFTYRIPTTSPIDLIRFDPGGAASFDNGVIELWGRK